MDLLRSPPLRTRPSLSRALSPSLSFLSSRAHPLLIFAFAALPFFRCPPALILIRRRVCRSLRVSFFVPFLAFSSLISFIPFSSAISLLYAPFPISAYNLGRVPMACDTHAQQIADMALDMQVCMSTARSFSFPPLPRPSASTHHGLSLSSFLHPLLHREGCYGGSEGEGGRAHVETPDRAAQRAHHSRRHPRAESPVPAVWRHGTIGLFLFHSPRLIDFLALPPGLSSVRECLT